MKRNLCALLTPLVILLCSDIPVAGQISAPNNRKFDFALIGDIPYSGLQVSQYPNVIADINASQVEFTVHAGDIKAGDTICADTVYTAIRDSFDTFGQALIYTPGDNEWTDCHRIRPDNGGFDPLGRLALLRDVFYTTEQSLGQRPVRVSPQRHALRSDR